MIESYYYDCYSCCCMHLSLIVFSCAKSIHITINILWNYCSCTLALVIVSLLFVSCEMKWLTEYNTIMQENKHVDWSVNCKRKNVIQKVSLYHPTNHKAYIQHYIYICTCIILQQDIIVSIKDTQEASINQIMFTFLPKSAWWR